MDFKRIIKSSSGLLFAFHKMKTQKQKVLEVMQENIKKWLPAHYFVGVKQGINGKVFLSYKAPARLSEIYKEFYIAIDRRQEVRDSSRYYSYKLTRKIY